MQCILGFGTTDQILGQWNNELMDRITNGSVFGRYGYDFGSTDLFLEETEPIRFWMNGYDFGRNGSDFRRIGIGFWKYRFLAKVRTFSPKVTVNKLEF